MCGPWINHVDMIEIVKLELKNPRDKAHGKPLGDPSQDYTQVANKRSLIGWHMA